MSPAPGARFRRQHGAALLLTLLALAIGVGGVLLSRLNQDTDVRRSEATEAALATAKTALIGHAVTRSDWVAGLFGALPCPDLDTAGGFDEGEAHAGACGAAGESVLGRLPWKTLGLPPTRDGDGECLWYAVSGLHKEDGATMLNADSNGLFDVYLADGVRKLAGALPSTRAAAVILAPGDVIGAQSRSALPSGVERCRGHYGASDYLESSGGIDNAALATPSAGLAAFVAGAPDGAVNDRLSVITRGELAAAVRARNDYVSKMNALTSAAARCVADYATSNPAAGDLRLPWPAPLALADYRDASQYDDTTSGDLAGRLPDVVASSSAAIGKPAVDLLSACDTAAVPEWDAEIATLWAHWKDHLFYAVAGAHAPDAATPTACGACLTVNGSGAYAAVVMFAGPRLGLQVRDAPPHDADTKSVLTNYLEGRNASNHPNAAGDGDYQSDPASPTFNDVLYCVDAATLAVAPC